MNFYRRLFKKREYSISSDTFNVILKTKKYLSEEQKNAIIVIVKDGIMSGDKFSDIAIEIMMSTGIYDTVILNRIKDCVEVIF